MRNPKLVPYETIVRATSGEPEAVDEVLRHYSKRIRIASLENGGSMSILWTKKVERLCCFFKFLILLLLWCQITNRAMYPLTIIPAFYVFKDCSAGFL